MGCSFRPDWVAGFLRIKWQLCTGLGGRNHRNTHPMTWNVMVALRQWNRVQDSLAANQEDQLIIEGYPLMQGSQHVLLAQSCVSMLQQRAHKQAQRAQAEPTP
jgi:hypothetical protein